MTLEVGDAPHADRAADSERGADPSPFVWLVDRFAPPFMFGVTILWLALLAGGLQSLRSADAASSHGMAFWLCMAAIWPLYGIELALHLAIGSRRWRQHLASCFAPPVRLAARDRRSGDSVWLPWLGWTRAGREGYRRVERAASGPMIAMALLVLPILLIEFCFAERVARQPILSRCLETATSLIWLGFSIEFIIMMGLVDKRLRYLREHWVDLAVILLPFVAFLRVLRLGQLARLQQITRLSRVYRLRGLSMRFYRALAALNLLRRVARANPERRLAALRDKLAEKEQELAALHAEIDEIEAQLAGQPSMVARAA